MQDSTQEAVFDEVKNFVQSALDGYNVSLLAYGQVCLYVRGVYVCVCQALVYVLEVCS